MNHIGHIKHNTPPITDKGFLIYKYNKDTEMFIDEIYLINTCWLNLNFDIVNLPYTFGHKTKKVLLNWREIGL